MNIPDTPRLIADLARARRRRFDPVGKVAFITGGGDGIGRTTALQLAARGADVVIADRHADRAAAVAAEIGGRSLAVTVDVTDREGMAAAVREATEQLGGIDLVIANAGITPPPGTLRTTDPAFFDAVLAVNLTGVLNTVGPAIDGLIARTGHVVVVASCAAFCPPLGGAAYMISKAAVEQLARAYRLELAPHDVTVTTCYYGIVDTQLARATLDQDELGTAVNAMLPSFLSDRITADRAAEVLLTAIERRAASAMAPATWRPYAALRGLLNPLVDQYLMQDHQTRSLLRDLEARQKENP